jgi:hypothetical protein
MMEICPKCNCNIEQERRERRRSLLKKRLKNIEIARLKAIKKLDKKNKER